MNNCNHIIGYWGYCGEMEQVEADFSRSVGCELQTKHNFCPVCGKDVKALAEECDAIGRAVTAANRAKHALYVTQSSTFAS